MPRASDGNRCRASEIEDLGLTAAQARPRRGATAPETPKARNNSAPPIPAARRSPRVEESVNKLRSMDDKVEILRRYSEWVAGGKVKSECPNRDLVEQYGCSINEPKRLYDKVLETGTVDNNWHQREQGYPDAIWDEMVTIIREHRSRQRVASLRKIESSLKKTSKGKPTPGRKLISKVKKSMGFVKIKVKKKPKLSKKLWDGRWEMATKQSCATEAEYMKSIERTVFLDEKWSSEHKGTNDAIEARKSSPVPPNILFRAVDHETRTQMIKVMFLLVVSGTKKIGYYELDFKQFNKDHDTRTKAGKKATGVTATYLRGIFILQEGRQGR